MRIHEQREVETGLRADETDDAADEEDEPPQKKRRGGEVGRDFICEIEGCGKDFKSVTLHSDNFLYTRDLHIISQKKALSNHHNVNHLGRRDFVCTYPDCNRAFGYKHLLQRHLTRVHVPESEDEGSQGGDMDDTVAVPEVPRETQTTGFSIDDITGMSYSANAKAQVQQMAKLECPYPDTSVLLEGITPRSNMKCHYVFTRAYDLRRHLKSEHSVDVDKDIVDGWVRRAKRAKVGKK